MHVDDAGAHAGRALRDRCDGVPVPGSLPAHRSHPMVRVTAIAVAVALVLTGAVVVARSVDGGTSTATRASPMWTHRLPAKVFGPRVAQVDVAGNSSGFVVALRRDPRRGEVKPNVELWSSTDGRTWARRSTPERAGVFATVAATDRGFVALVTTAPGGLHTYVSDDGTDWSRGEDLPGRFDPGFLGSDGKVFTYQDASANTTFPVWLSSDGRRWTRHSEPYVPLARLGPRAVTLTSVSTMQPDRVAISRDLRHWTVLPGLLPPRVARPLVADTSNRRLFAIQYEPSYDVPGGHLWTSSDARRWREITSFHARFPTANPDHIVQSGGWWVLGGNRGAGSERRTTMWVTPDLSHWTEMPPRLRGDVGRSGSVVLAASGKTVLGVGYTGVGPPDLWVWHRPR